MWRWGLPRPKATRRLPGPAPYLQTPQRKEVMTHEKDCRIAMLSTAHAIKAPPPLHLLENFGALAQSA